MSALFAIIIYPVKSSGKFDYNYLCLEITIHGHKCKCPCKYYTHTYPNMPISQREQHFLAEKRETPVIAGNVQIRRRERVETFKEIDNKTPRTPLVAPKRNKKIKRKKRSKSYTCFHRQ